MANTIQESSIEQTDSETSESQNWAIVGGGMLGLYLAMKLARAGQSVTLYEAAPEIGGLASPWQLEDVTWDRHYHVTLLSDSWLRKLLSEVGLEKEIRWVETKTGFYTNGKHYSMSNNLEFLTFPPLSLMEKFRLGWTIFYASKLKNWKRLEKIPVTDWLKKISGKSTFEKMWLPLLKAKLGSAFNKVSAAFIWSYISRMYEARRTGLKKEMFGYVPGGYARILKTLEQELTNLGVEVRTGAKISEIGNRPDGKVEVKLLKGHSETHDKLVATVPSNVFARICPNLTEEEQQRHQGIDYLGIICSSLLLKKPLEGYYVTNITETWVPYTAVIEMTTIVDPQELNGHHLVYLPKYITAEDPAWKLSDEEVKEQFLAALGKMYPHIDPQEDVLAFQTSRVKNVMALPTLSYSEKLPPMVTSLPNVWAVNSAQILGGVLNVNETLALADRAWNELMTPEISSAEHCQTTR